MRLAGTRRAAVVAGLLAAGAVLAWLLALQDVVAPARVVAGVLLAFVLPGGAGTTALFPGLGPSRLERIVLAPALSLAVLVLGGLLLDVLGLHLTAGTWGGLTAVVTVALAGVGFARRRASGPPAGQSAGSPAGRPVPPSEPRPRSVGAGRTAWRLAPLAVAVALLGGAAWIGLHSAAAQDQEAFTALSLVPDDDPSAADQVRPVTLAVDSREGDVTGYTLKVHADAGSDWQFSLRLQPGEVWKHDLDVPITGRVTADLFKGDDDSTPYRTVFLSGLQ
jgi:uncharacterized membrane protein